MVKVTTNMAQAHAKVLHGRWLEQWCYSWLNAFTDIFRQPLNTFLMSTVIAISISLTILCYLFWKNSLQLEEKWCSIPQMTVYLDKSLDDKGIKQIISVISKSHGIKSVNYLSPEESMIEFRNWSGLNKIMDLLDENPIPAVVMITPKCNLQNTQLLINLRNNLRKLSGIEDIRIENSWVIQLALLTSLVGKVTLVIGSLMTIAIFLVISNCIKYNVLVNRDTINIMKLIGATDGFIMRPFLNSGIIFGLLGALLSLIFSTLFIWQLSGIVAKVGSIFNTTFNIQGLLFDEAILVILVTIIIGWLASWVVTFKHLRYFAVG